VGSYSVAYNCTVFLPYFESFVIVAWWWTVQTETCSHVYVTMNVAVFDGFVTDCFDMLPPKCEIHYIV
jgi:hypothetical protein